MPRSSRSADVDPRDLYAAAPYLSQDDRRKLGLRVPLTIYAQDPLVAAVTPALGLEQIELDWEFGLRDGPTSARVVVVDRDLDTGQTFEPAQVRWTQKRGWHFLGPDGDLIDGSHPESPQFHQVNVWAVVQRALAFYESGHVLGRSIPWAFEGNRLIVIPHAGLRQNAFYDRRQKALLLYYSGPPAQRVYTCLSHDIVAHETGHAILDGCRPYYHEVTSRETAAFHEFVADLTAIISAMRDNATRQVVADVTGGDLSRDRAIQDLAEEFARDLVGARQGEANRYYLRSAGNQLGMADIADAWAPHDCSQVLTGALFEILSGMTLKHLEQGESPRQALWHATERFTRIALRGLDYCPPVGIEFIDYARAVLHADALAYPLDDWGYRAIAEQVFRRRGLTDLAPEVVPYAVDFRRYDIERLSRSRTEAYHLLHANRELLHIPPQQDFWVVDLYDTDKVVAAGRRLPREVVVEYLWREEVPLQGPRFGRLSGRSASLLCGGTLVFDGRGNVLYFVHKPGSEHPVGEARREALLDYVAGLVLRGGVALAAEPGQSEGASPLVLAREDDGALRLEMTPRIHHWQDR
ncbi:MAG: serine protease [Anaerolineae bacterium]|nr:serine protease [Anaerolineae bacterium]